MRLVMVSILRPRKAAALREVALRLVRLPKLDRELQRQNERERLGVSAAAMKAAIEEAQEPKQTAQHGREPNRQSAAGRGSRLLTETRDETDDAVIARLAKLAPIDCARQIEPAAAQLGIKVGFLNRLVAAARDKDQPANAAVRGVKVAEPTPAAEPVDTGAMLTAITDGRPPPRHTVAGAGEGHRALDRSYLGL